MSEKTIFPCIHVGEGDIAPRVITCGDPARAELISQRLQNPVCLAKNREYWTFSGTYKGTPVTITSHGVGAGGAAIAFESLWRAGAKVIIRVGTCGGMQDGIDAGSIVIPTASCREEGVTEKMIPLSYPAVCDGDVVSALSAAARGRNIKANKGIVLTQALFYPGLLESRVKLYAKAGVVAMDNEVAALLVVSSLHGVKAGAILAADAKAFELVGVDDYKPDQSAVSQAVEDEIDIALDAIVNVPLD
ncbi:MAG: uridine phosphorylase [Firmicutes bacterium HGW-Firmicutes-16]|nr:MAG: uridine phosphorylase [Firmicutes bacterium HGW-Firmicutes-16]